MTVASADGTASQIIDVTITGSNDTAAITGTTTADVDKIAEELTLKKKAKPAFKGYRGFPASLCISVNDEVVHGIPSSKRVLRQGDIVGLDFGVIYDG